jgi:hypothetical protein
MMSPEFMRKLQELRQQRLRTQDFQKWKAANPTSPTGEGRWNAAPWTGQTAQTIVYDTTNGKAFPNPRAALSAGVSNFSYQIPSGMTVDWSYWDQYRQPPPPAPKPVRPITVVDQTVLPGPNPSGPAPHESAADNAADNAADDTTPVDPFSGVNADRLAEAQRYADAGMMGRAKLAFEQGGGVWSKDIHRRMKREREEVDVYGGKFDFDWASRGITNAADLEQIKTWAKGGLFGKIKQFMEAKKKGSFSKDLHVNLDAYTHRGKHDYVAPSSVTKDTPGAYWDEKGGKWRMPQPDGTRPGAMPTSGGGGDES